MALLVGVLAMVFLIGFIVWAWTEPGSAPPGGNVPAPINVSGTGQVKKYVDTNNKGWLGVATDGYDSNYGLTVGNSTNVLGVKASGSSLFEKNLTVGGELKGVKPNGSLCGGNKILKYNSTDDTWDCADDAGITSESDPQVGTLTNGKWCTTDGSAVNCAANAPTAGSLTCTVKSKSVTYGAGSFGYATPTCDSGYSATGCGFEDYGWANTCAIVRVQPFSTYCECQFRNLTGGNCNSTCWTACCKVQ